MQQTTFVKLSALGFGLVLVSFLIRGFSGLIFPSRTAAMLSAPTMLAGGGILVFLTLRSVLAVSGVAPLK